MGIDFCNHTERLNLRLLFGTKRDMDIKPLYTYLCPVIIFICFFSILFNAILMGISRQSKVVNKSPILLLSLNLAVTDLIASLLNGLGILFNSYLPEVYDIKMGQCSMLMFEVVRYAALVASALHLLALAFVHYRGIVNPLHYRSTIFFSQHLSRTINIISIVCWIIPLTIMIVWFSSSPCQGFQSPECDYLFLLGFTFRYMVLTLFALPLLLMSAIYLRIFIIISKHQKGRRINHERSALNRGVTSATGALVTAAAVNLPELITNTQANVCAACVARAMNKEPGDLEDDPTIFILSEETIDDDDDDDDDDDMEQKNIAEINKSDVSSSDDQEPDGCYEGSLSRCGGFTEVNLDGTTSNNRRLNNSRSGGVGNGSIRHMARTSADADGGLKVRNTQPTCDKDIIQNQLVESKQNPICEQSTQLLEENSSLFERRAPDPKRGFIFAFKQMIMGNGGSSGGRDFHEQRIPSTVQVASASRDSSSNEQLAQQQGDQMRGIVVELNDLQPFKDKNGRATKEENRQIPNPEVPLGCKVMPGSFDAECTTPSEVASLGEDPAPKRMPLIDARFEIDIKARQDEAEIGEINERAEVVASLLRDGVKLDRRLVSGGCYAGSDDQTCKVALKTQTSLGSMTQTRGGSATTTFAKEVRLLTLLPDSKTADVSGQSSGSISGVGRVLLRESTFHGSARQTEFERKATRLQYQQSNPVSHEGAGSPLTFPRECTCDNKSRQLNSKLSRSNTIGARSQEIRVVALKQPTTAISTDSHNTATNSTTTPNKTMIILSSSHNRPSISSTNGQVLVKYQLYGPSEIITRSSNKTNLENFGARPNDSVGNTTNATYSSTYEPQRRHIHASAIPQTNTKALVTTLFILGTYLISYVPAIIFQALTCTDNCPYPLYDISFSRRVLLGAMTNLLLIAKSIIDPFIYSYRMNEIQTAITRYLSKRRSKTSFANSIRTSQRFNNRSFHNSNYQTHQPVTSSQRNLSNQNHHLHNHSNKQKNFMVTDQRS